MTPARRFSAYMSLGLAGLLGGGTLFLFMVFLYAGPMKRIELELGERASCWRQHADRMRAVILEQTWDHKQQCFVESFGGRDIDASLLLLHELGFVAPDDPRFLGTLAAVEQRLKRGDHILRYSGPDDFGNQLIDAYIPGR